MEPGIHQAFILFFGKPAFFELNFIDFCGKGICLINQKISLGIVYQDIFLIGSLSRADILLLLQGFLGVRVPADCGNQFVIVELRLLVKAVHRIDDHRRSDAQA